MNTKSYKVNVIVVLVLGLTAVLFVTQCTSSQNVGQVPQDSSKVDPAQFAQEALQNYVKYMLNESNAANYGFTDLKQAYGATVGTPYTVKYINLQDLQVYKQGIDVSEILKDAHTLWFPVQVDGRTITKIEIVDMNGQWVAGEFGGIASVAEIEAATQQVDALLKRSEIIQTQPAMLLKVPDLNAVFLYVESDQGKFLIPAMNQPQRFQLEPVKLYQVDKFLPSLSEIAKTIDLNKVH